MDKLYIVKYCANECDDLGYDSPYPIFYSLNEDKARKFFKKKCSESINHFEEWLKDHPELKGNEDYQIEENEVNALEYSMGNWFYRYEFEEAILEKDLRYKL